MERDIGKKIIGQCLGVLFILSGCMPSAPTSRNAASVGGSAQTSAGSGNGNGASGNDNTVGSGTTLPPTVEIRHLIEPNLSTDPTYYTGTGQAGGGSYVRKLTLPKNFAGRLYIAGININSLNSSFIKVRFRFGVGRQAISDIPATIMKAPGITPATNISVLALDLRSQPFRNVRLPYDLFDYGNYDSDGDLIDFTNGEEPVQDNRDSNLFCRGLRVADDPTFGGVGACDSQGEECLYSYAKISDQGLIKESNGVLVPLTPSLPQYKSVVGPEYFQDFPYQIVKKPLEDTIPTSASDSHEISSILVSQFSASFGSRDISFTNDFSNPSTNTMWDRRELSPNSFYYYRGPYRISNFDAWEFKFPFSEIHGPGRIFRENAWVNYPSSTEGKLLDDNSTTGIQNRLYYQSYLFPLATKLNIGGNVTHMSSASVLGTRTTPTSTTATQTLWMDGSNARAQSRDLELNHIGSCNVSSTIEVIAKDANGNDFIIASSKDIKLQLVRPIEYSTSVGDDVLFSNFKTCTSNATCGGSSCCLNNRCWDESLISQCSDDTLNNGNRTVGEACTTDYQCSSFCCNKTSGTCAPHNTILTAPVLCNKQTGDSCIAKEFCAKTPVQKCLIVKTGTTPSGEVTCRQQCFFENVFGDCKNGSCVPPEQPTIPVFDPDAEGACDGAVTAPNF